MKNDFKKMETEMDLLASNMASITSFSDQINDTLHDTRQKINKLSGVHALLQKLQFLFKLPTTLKSRMEEKNYIQVRFDPILVYKYFLLKSKFIFRPPKITFTPRECYINMVTCHPSKVSKQTANQY